MILELHLCGPKGAGQRQLIDRALELVQLDNQMLVQAMLKAGMPVPDRIEELGLAYQSPSLAQAQANRQAFFGYRQMLTNGWFSCGEAAAWEAAVLCEKHKVPATAFSNPITGRDDGIFHAVYRTPTGVVDPVERFFSFAAANPKGPVGRP